MPAKLREYHEEHFNRTQMAKMSARYMLIARQSIR